MTGTSVVFGTAQRISLSDVLVLQHHRYELIHCTKTQTDSNTSKDDNNNNNNKNNNNNNNNDNNAFQLMMS